MSSKRSLIDGVLIKRYKRFLADVTLGNGEVVTAHCPNSGSMKSCWEPGWSVKLSYHNDPKRKLKYTWEWVHNGTCWICVNTLYANTLAKLYLNSHQIPEISDYTAVQPEVKYGSGSRIDFLLTGGSKDIYVEVKSVTYLGDDGALQFPDAVTTRGQKHLRELMNMVEQGHRAVMLYMLMRSDGHGFHAASDVDPVYAELLSQAQNAGVEVVVFHAAAAQAV